MYRTARLAVVLLYAAAIALPLHAANPPADVLYVEVSPLFVAGGSAVVRFDVDADGRPTQRETYPTGGSGRGFTSPQGMAVDPRGRFLFVANNESADISVFRVLLDGSLGPTVRQFPVGGEPVDLQVHPSGRFLYAGDFTYGLVHVFRIDDTGGLTQIQELRAFLFPGEMAVDPAGERLFVSAFLSIHVFAISAEGTLTEIADSPFPLAGTANRTLSLRLDPSGHRLITLDLDVGLSVYDVAASGSLSLVGGSPFYVSSFADTFALTPDGRSVYASSPYDATLDGFRVPGSGKLAEINGSPFAGDYSAAKVLIPAGFSSLYEIGRDTQRISVFAVVSNGRLSQAAYSPVEVTDDASRAPNGAAFLGRPGFAPVGP